MGGAAKHLMQLHHDPKLSFQDITEIFELAVSGNLIVTEKLDGMNVVFTWDSTRQCPKFARNSGDIYSGGMDRAQLLEKFRGRGSVEVAFLESYDALCFALDGLQSPLLGKIFNDGKRWISVEILGPINPNIVHYDRKEIIVHMTKLDDDDDEFNFSVNNLFELFPQLNVLLAKVGWSISGPSYVNLQNVSLTSFNQRLGKLAGSFDAPFYHDVSTYTWHRVYTILLKMGLREGASAAVTDRILGEPGCLDLRKLKKIYPEYADVINDIVKDEWNIFKQAQEPLAKLIGDFAMAIMQDVNSSHISDNKAEITRLREATRNEIDVLQKLDDPNVQKFLNEQMYQLGPVENIDTTIEGVVFQYKEKSYKFTGSFAAANRILGYRRYGR